MRSTSSMLWLVTSSAVPSVRGDVEERRPDPVGDVGVEAGGGLVEHEEGGLVQHGLHDAHEGPLTRRQLHAHAVGEVGDAEALEAGVDDRIAGLAAAVP